MSLKMTTQAWKAKLPHNEKYVLLALADCHNERTNQCNPGHDALAEMTGISKRQIIRIISSLEAKKFVTSRRSRRTENNEYFLSFPEVTYTAPRRSAKLSPQRSDTDDTSRSDICDTLEVTSAANCEVTSTTPLIYEEPDIDEPEEEPVHAQARACEEESPFSDEVKSLGTRLAECRKKYAGMAKVTPASIQFYCQVVKSILNAGEVTPEDLNIVVTWFETTEDGARTWDFGMGNISANYQHVLKRSVASYLSKARSRNKGTRSYRDRIMTHDAPKSRLLTPEEQAQLEQEKIPF